MAEPTQVDYQRVAMEQHAELETLRAASHKAEVDSALAGVLSAKPLVDSARPHIIALLRDQVTLQPDGRGGKVPFMNGQPLAQAIDETLKRPDYQHFLPSGQRSASAAGYAPGAADAGMPKTLGEAFTRTIKEQQATQGDWRTNPRLAMPTEPAPKK
jgi:hypothetical protein